MRCGWISALGALLISAAVLLTAHNLHEARQAAEFAEQTALRLTDGLSRTHAVPQTTEASGTEEAPHVAVDGTEYLGLLEVPSLGLTLPVAAQWDYPTLKRTPCRYSGTSAEDNLIILAHNYHTHFGRLKQLAPGAEVYLTELSGARTAYIVTGLERISPDGLPALESQAALTLLTCTPGGKSRLAVLCERAERDVSGQRDP